MIAPLAMMAVAGLTLSGCGGAGGGDGGGGEPVTVLMVNNPQMVDLQKLTAEHFTAETGIEVDYTVLPENDVRARISQEFSSQAGQYDVASLSNYEIPIYSERGWLAPLDELVMQQEGFKPDDFIDPVIDSLKGSDGQTYGIPFYGESSFLMYRKDVFKAEGLTMPENPTWQEVADLAAKLDGAKPGMSGICLRGQPGWGQVFAPLTTVVNTFGGTWFTEDWQAKVNAPEFVEATEFYVELVRKYGEDGAPQAGFVECLTNMTQGNSAMWYDATSAAGSLEAEDSPVAGKIGYVPAPVVETDNSGWLYSWAWGIQAASDNKENAAEFIAWASSQEYEELVGQELGWTQVPAGKRESTYENPKYQEAASAFYQETRNAIANVNLQPEPAPGIQFVAIPEFTDMATQISQDISAAIAGQMSVQKALDNGQRLAEEVAAAHRE